MILDRTWNKKEQKLTISYINKAGKREFYSKFIHHFKSYEYDKDGDIETWNGRRCRKVYKDTRTYVPNEFDILEYMYELPKDINDKLHAQNFPKIYTFDIETEYTTKFPDPAIAEFNVTAISLVGPDMSCIVYGLNDMDSGQVARFRERYLNWINENDFARTLMTTNNWHPKVLYQKFDTEEGMLQHLFKVIIPQIAVLCGWNSWSFDWQYLVNRAKRLFGDNAAYGLIRCSSPTGELSKLSWEEMDKKKHQITCPAHSKIIDYQAIVKQYDSILKPYESFSLDWVSSRAVGAHKIKYSGGLQQLYERDHEWYYYYNAIDSLLVLLIHYKLKSLESPCAVSSVTLVPLTAAFGQVALSTANVFEEFYKEGKRVVDDSATQEHIKVPYEGAFTGCNPGIYKYTCCFDFASLYPSQIQTCNFSMENFMQKTVPNNVPGMPDVKVPWTEEELDAFRKDKNYFVSVMGNVYKNDKDYCFKIVQRKIKQQRDIYKYTGSRIESELLTEIDRLIQEKTQQQQTA
jgi:DNA polymerase elongation subunit (family B)